MSWDAYFMQIAEAMSLASTCMSRKVGAVAVINRMVVAIGFNGSPCGVTNCEEKGICIRKEQGAKSGEMLDICRAVHAEANVIAMASRRGISLEGATLYVNTKPCMMCEKQIINCGIKKVIYSSDYPTSDELEMFKEAGVEVINYNNA